MIPLDVDDITTEWLSEALNADVASVEIVDRHSGTTGRVRIAVKYSGGPSLPEELFVKLAPFDERQRRFVDAVGLGIAEARLYRDVASALPVRVPHVFHASVDDDGRYVMVLEDLIATGCAFPSPNDDDIGETTGRIVDELARLHAQYWESPALDRDLAWVREGYRQAFGRGGPFIQKAIDRFADEMPLAFRRLGELYVAETPRIAELYETGPHTLAHGDPHLGNLFLDRGRPGFYDWGMVMARSGIWDVAYVICNRLPSWVRRAHEREWIDRYRAGLASSGVHLDENAAWEQYRLFAVYAWSSSTSTAGVGNRWQPQEYGHQGMTAATAAIEDLDSIGLLEELLGSSR